MNTHSLDNDDVITNIRVFLKFIRNPPQKKKHFFNHPSNFYLRNKNKTEKKI